MPKTENANNLKILIVASEAVPFAKTGGLADVIGALPIALKKAGCDVRVAIPCYKIIDEEKFKIKDTGLRVNIDIALFNHIAVIKESVFPGTDIPVYFIKNSEFFDRDELYRTPQGEYWDNAERFMFFSKVVIEMIKLLNFKPDVININDWHTGLIPVYLKTVYRNDDFYKNIATVYSIHNIAYQGLFDKEKLSHAGLPMDLYSIDKMEFYGGINYMKGGIVFSDIINTVSKKYREEIMTPEFGYGLDGVLRTRSNDLYGILNGIDYKLWNPATDDFLPIKYDEENLEAKEEIKKYLLNEVGLKYIENIPLLGLVSRLDDQKGIDFIAAIIDEMMRLNLQFVILGTGEEKYHNLFYHIKSKYPEKISVNIKFDNRLAHLIYAGADIFLMPSRFEPCGLGQMIALKYGTVPIVRETGGLADTVSQYNFKTKQGNGFVFSGYDPYALLYTIKICLDAYKNKTVWRKIQQNGMKADFSWEESAKEYIEIYKKAIEKKKI